MTVQVAGVLGALIGMAVSYALLKTHIANVKADHCQDAYEKGWSEGYNVGWQLGLKQNVQPKARAKRVKTIRKADP